MYIICTVILYVSILYQIMTSLLAYFGHKVIYCITTQIYNLTCNVKS